MSPKVLQILPETTMADIDPRWPEVRTGVRIRSSGHHNRLDAQDRWTVW